MRSWREDRHPGDWQAMDASLQSSEEAWLWIQVLSLPLPSWVTLVERLRPCVPVYPLVKFRW